MKKILLLAGIALAAMVSCTKQQQPAEPESVTPAEALLARMDTLRNHGYMYGHQDDPFYGITWEW